MCAITFNVQLSGTTPQRFYISQLFSACDSVYSIRNELEAKNKFNLIRQDDINVEDVRFTIEG